MAVNDVVIFTPIFTARMGAQDTVLARVQAEDAGPPATATLFFETGLVVAGVPQSILSKVFASAFFGLARMGTWQALNDYPEGITPEQPAPKSKAAGGIVVATFMLGAYDAQNPDNAVYTRLAINNGRTSLLVAETAPSGATQTAPTANVLIDRPGVRNS